MISPKKMFSEKKVFLKKNVFIKTHVSTKKMRSNGFKNQQSKQEVDSGFDLWSCFFFSFSVFPLFSSS